MRRRLALLAAFALAGTVAPAAVAQAAEPLLTVGVEPSAGTLERATYELLVTNHGAATAQDVRVGANVPSAMSVVSADPAATGACAAAGTPCEWMLGEMPPGSSRTITVVYALVAEATYSVTAVVTEGAEPGHDTNTDTTFTLETFTASDDTWVDGGEAAGTNHGACDELRVAAGTPSGFVEADPARAEVYAKGKDVRVFAAELGATVKAPAPAASIGVHALQASDWAEGSGSCAGAAGTVRQPRAGDEPSAAAAATDTAPVPLAGQRARWDVTADFDTLEERRRYAGWALRATGGTGATTLHSAEGPAAEAPALRLAYTEKTATSVCVDAFAEDATAPSDRAQRIEAVVTDGGERISNGETEACSGTPVQGHEVKWKLFDTEDGAPDAWFSVVDGLLRPIELGAGGAAGPNAVATSSDAGGWAFVELRLGSPYADGENAGTDRIDVAGEGTGAPDEGSECGSGETCAAENQREDDVRRSWVPADPPPPSEDDGGGGATTTAAPSPSPPLAADPAAGPVARSVSLAATAARARAGGSVRLLGRVASAAPACTGPREYVEIHRRPAGSRSFADFASVSTQADGTFELPLLVDASAEYLAVAPARDGCLAASSGAARVLARPRVVVRARRLRGRRVAITGRVVPATPGAAVLQRRGRRRWVDRASLRLGPRGRFSFRVGAGRAVRVRFRPRDEAGLAAVSRRLPLRRR